MAKDRALSGRSPKSPLIKPNASKQHSESSSEPAAAAAAQAAAATSTANQNQSQGQSQSQSQATARTSWTGASWRGKATPVSGIARESITANPSVDKASAADPSRRPDQPIAQGLNTPSKSTPSIASTTPLHATSGNAKSELRDLTSEKDIKNSSSQPQGTASGDETKTAAADGSNTDVAQERPAPAPAWGGWWYRGSSDAAPAKTKEEDLAAKAKDSHAPTLGALEGGNARSTSGSAEDAQPQADEPNNSSRSSWFGLLGSMAPLQAQGEPASTPPAPKGDLPQPAPSNYTAIGEAPIPSKLPNRPSSGSWAFWVRDNPKQDGNRVPRDRREQVGELAVSGTESQSKPQIASVGKGVVEASDSGSKKRERAASSERSVGPSSVKRKSIASLVGLDSDPPKSETSSESEASAYMHESVLKTSVDKPAPKKQKPSTSAATPNANLVLPLFESVYPAASPASYWSKLAWVIGRGQANHAKHLTVSTTPHRIKRGLAIGVHGLFPSAMLQKILGPPTGTSIRFADGAAAAIRKISEERGYACEIEKVALEGEGLIGERIDTLWKLLLNWMHHIQRADFIFVACHSQGVPVAVSLIAKLLNFGCVQNSARIGVCGMAGVNLGPFASYQSRFLQGSAAELFSLSHGRSAAAQAYASALDAILQKHVRIVYVGSIDDQLVSMESSTFANAAHPYIFRAVYVDGRIHAPDFLTRLVGFALKLRNLGISDHGLIRELSGPLAGSLYTGEGHSRIYEEQAVYELALRHALDTDSLDAPANPPLELKPYEAGGAAAAPAANPYFLPWAMRGMLEEEYVRTQLKGETDALLGMFDNWRPQSKVLKDVKFRLEAVKSKL